MLLSNTISGCVLWLREWQVQYCPCWRSFDKMQTISTNTEEMTQGNLRPFTAAYWSCHTGTGYIFSNKQYHRKLLATLHLFFFLLWWIRVNWEAHYAGIDIKYIHIYIFFIAEMNSVIQKATNIKSHYFIVSTITFWSAAASGLQWLLSIISRHSIWFNNILNGYHTGAFLFQ